MEQKLDLKDKAYGLCRDFLSGSWKEISSADMQFKPITGGMSNILYLCSLPSTHTPLNGEPSQVLLRMYGQIHAQEEGQETTITDSVIFMLLSERKLGPKLYGIFPGGRLEEYIPARAMTCKELHDQTLSAIISRKLANVHCLDVPLHKEPTWFSDTIETWLRSVRSRSPCELRNKNSIKLARQMLNIDFENEFIWLKSFLADCESPVVFSHNDLQEGNILLPDVPANKKPRIPSANCPAIVTDDRVVLIDFEYCSYNFRGFDLANHFCEWAFDYSNPNFPHFYANLSDLPTEKERRTFIREYLNQTRKRRGDEMTEIDTEDHLLHEADCYLLASHFLWSIWGLNMAFTSEIEFGYVEYGKVRLNAYYQHKEKLLKKTDSANDSAQEQD
ncbi:Choline/ethanolamine kinase [Halotydeus destructor]|nr:Choline/ethanolamine kinase [Halotydeus destructor]